MGKPQAAVRAADILEQEGQALTEKDIREINTRFHKFMAQTIPKLAKYISSKTGKNADDVLTQIIRLLIEGESPVVNVYTRENEEGLDIFLKTLFNMDNSDPIILAVRAEIVTRVYSISQIMLWLKGAKGMTNGDDELKKKILSAIKLRLVTIENRTSNHMPASSSQYHIAYGPSVLSLIVLDYFHQKILSKPLKLWLFELLDGPELYIEDLDGDDETAIELYNIGFSTGFANLMSCLVRKDYKTADESLIGGSVISYYNLESTSQITMDKSPLLAGLNRAGIYTEKGEGKVVVDGIVFAFHMLLADFTADNSESLITELEEAHERKAILTGILKKEQEKSKLLAQNVKALKIQLGQKDNVLESREKQLREGFKAAEKRYKARIHTLQDKIKDLEAAVKTGTPVKPNIAKVIEEKTPTPRENQIDDNLPVLPNIDGKTLLLLGGKLPTKTYERLFSESKIVRFKVEEVPAFANQHPKADIILLFLDAANHKLSSIAKRYYNPDKLYIIRDSTISTVKQLIEKMES